MFRSFNLAKPVHVGRTPDRSFAAVVLLTVITGETALIPMDLRSSSAVVEVWRRNFALSTTAVPASGGRSSSAASISRAAGRGDRGRSAPQERAVLRPAST